MTDTILAGRIRTLAESGTPGPWQLAATGYGPSVDDPYGGMIFVESYGVTWTPNRHDAGIVVAAVNALPALADLVEAVTLRHWPQDGRDCAECGDEWPCPTATALDALAVALGVAQ